MLKGINGLKRQKRGAMAQQRRTEIDSTVEGIGEEKSGSGSMRKKLEKQKRREELWVKLFALFCLSAKRPSGSGFSKEE
jgi:hypothetical protein